MTPPARNIAVNGDKPVEEIPADVYHSDVKKLRDRWELACVLNFLNVFEDVIDGNLKITAEEIEAALIKPNSVLAKLHIALLKGIPPVSRNLNDSDAWITSLIKKLAMWWPWVAEGEIPLRATKGEEIQRYKQFDPTVRLVMLKALCEIRAEQYDAVSHINDVLKNGYQISSIRKDKIGEDRNGASYWYEGNAIIGHRLYREVIKSESRTNDTSREYLPAISSWETIATNLEEFRKVVGELLSRGSGADVAIAKSIEAGAISILERLQKNKERALKRKQRLEMLISYAQNPVPAGIKRSCRNRRTVSYTFDDYDRTINEALQQSKVRITAEEKRPERNHVKHAEGTIGGSIQLTDVEADLQLEGSYREKDSSINSNTKSKMPKVFDNVNDDEDEDCSSVDKMENDDDRDDERNSSNSDLSISDDTDNKAVHPQNQRECIAEDHARLHMSKGVSGFASHHVGGTRSPGTKNRLRQRPVQNSALDSAVVPDSDDD